MANDLAAYTSSQELLHQALLDAGATQRGQKYFCPFHEDSRTPNGAIHEKDGAWKYKCFSCGFGGDYFDVLARAQGRPLEQVIAETVRGGQAPPTPARRPAKAEKKPTLFASPRDIIALAERKLQGKHVATYEYTHPDTRALDVAVIRINKPDGSKEFWQYYPVDGGFYLGLPKDRARPLYNRARVARAGTVLFVEGEKCVHALHDIGLVATCAIGGANTDMSKTDWTPLAGKTVVLWPDNDEPDPTGKVAGQHYIQNAMKHMAELSPPPDTRTINIKSLELPVKGDAADYIECERRKGVKDIDIKGAILKLCEGATDHGPGGEVLQLVDDIARGIHKPIDFAFPQVSRQTNALDPETITIIGGNPGSGKSWFLIQNAMHWFDQDIPIAILMLERTRRYWLRRAMVIRAENSIHLDAAWMRAHPEDARAMALHHLSWMNKFGACIHVPPGHFTVFPYVMKWVAEQAARRTRIIIIDPITIAVLENNGPQFIEELRALSAMRSDIEAAGASLILSTHPKQGPDSFTMNALAGSAAYQRLADTILWLQHLDEDTEFTVKRVHKPPFGAPTIEEITVTCNRRLHILKARDGMGHGLKIAYHFEGKSVSFSEQGLITSSTHKNKAGA